MNNENDVFWFRTTIDETNKTKTSRKANGFAKREPKCVFLNYSHIASSASAKTKDNVVRYSPTS